MSQKQFNKKAKGEITDSGFDTLLDNYEVHTNLTTNNSSGFLNDLLINTYALKAPYLVFIKTQSIL